MFLNLSINLSGPICTCKVNMGWWFETRESDVFLLVHCETCGVTLTIPTDKIGANFRMPRQVKDPPPQTDVWASSINDGVEV